MELKFVELTDNSETHENVNIHNENTYVNTFENYWEQKETKPKKKKVSFDDILTNMNLVVNKSGVLQYMAPLQEIVDDRYQEHQQLEPAVKHSYIYNKYFKDYKDAHSPAPEVRVPKTMEEYKKMLLDDKIERIKQKKRISEIKSTKLLFTTNPEYNGQQRNINVRSSSNNLRKLNFY